MPFDVTPSSDPVSTLRTWYQHACERLPRDEAHRAALATATPDGHPSVRILLCRDIDALGRVFFYTNYTSHKGRALDQNPHAALVFHWPTLGRQLRVDGLAERVPGEVSDRYWAGRPRGSQLSAIVSPQSEPIRSPADLEIRRTTTERDLGEAAIRRPEHWGGYAVEPTSIEFWQEGEARLHTRLRFQRPGPGSPWHADYLAP